jgi:hypothetical protein
MGFEFFIVEIDLIRKAKAMLTGLGGLIEGMQPPRNCSR